MITDFLILANFFTYFAGQSLQLNTSKTDLLWCATSRRRHQLPTSALRIGSDLVKPSASVRDLGIYFDADLSMRCHIQKTVANCFAVAQYSTISSDVSVPYARRCCRCHSFGYLDYGNVVLVAFIPAYTCVFRQCSTLPGDRSPAYDTTVTSPTHSPVSTSWRSRSVFSLSWRQSSVVRSILTTWLQICTVCLTCRPHDVCDHHSLTSSMSASRTVQMSPGWLCHLISLRATRCHGFVENSDTHITLFCFSFSWWSLRFLLRPR